MTKWMFAFACLVGCSRSADGPFDAYGGGSDDAYGGGSDAAPPQKCRCDSCTKGTTKLCEVQHGPGNPCNPGIPGGTPPDFRWVVSQGSWQSCASISGSGTMTGYDYYGGTKQCTLQNCANSP
jgi:hypothetical protein